MSETLLRVLLVDDEESLRLSLAANLRDLYSYWVDDAANGIEAMQLIEKADGLYDVALVDAVIGEGPSGLEILGQIKAKYPDIEVIIFTGWGMQSGMEALRAGAYRYLAKPFNLDELALTIRFAAEVKWTRRERDYMAAMVKTSQGLTQARDLQEQLRLVWNFVQEQLDFTSFFIALYDSEIDVIHFPVVYHEGQPDSLPDLRLGADRSQWGLAGYVVKTGKEVYWDSSQQRQEVCLQLGISPFTKHKSSVSLFCIPLRMGDQILGVLSVQSYHQNVFNPVLLNAVRTLGHQVSIALENKRLYATSEQKAQDAASKANRLRTLQDLAVTINSSLDLMDIQKKICRLAVELVNVDHSGLVEFGLDLSEGKVVAEYPDRGTREINQAQGTVIPVSGSPALERLVNQQEILNISDLASDHSLGLTRDILLHLGIRSILIVPVVVQGRVVASFGLDAAMSPRVFSQDDIELCQAFANHVAVAIGNAQSFQAAKEGREYLRLLYEASSAIISQREPRKALQDVVDKARGATNAMRAMIIRVDEEGHPVDVIHSTGFERLIDTETSVRADGISHKVMVSGQSRFIPNVADVEEEAHPMMLEDGVKAAACLPLKRHGKNIGVLWIHFRDVHSFSETEQQALQLFASQSTIAYENAEKMRSLEQLRTAAQSVAEMTVLGGTKETRRTILENARRILNADIVTVYTFDWDDKLFKESEGIGYNDPSNMRQTKDVKRDSVLWKVIEEKNPYREVDVDDPEWFSGNFARSEGIKSAIALRLSVGKSGNRPVGVMWINYRSLHTPTDEDKQNALQFANQAAIAFHNAELLEDMKRDAATLRNLIDAGKAMSSTLNLSESLQSITEYARRIVGIGQRQPEKCISHIALLDDSKTKLHLESSSPPEFLKTLRENFEIDIDNSSKKSIAGRAVKETKSQIVQDVRLDPDYVELNSQTRSQLSVLLWVGDDIIGVLSIQSSELNAFSDEDLGYLELLAAPAALSIRNALRYDKTTETLAARTSLIHVSMTTSIWRHATEIHAITIRDLVGLIRSDLSKSSYDSLGPRLDMIEQLANLIHEKRISPLSVQEATPIEINELVRNRAERLWKQEPYRDVLLNLNIDVNDTMSVRISPEWLRQALDILIDNAVEATAGLSKRLITISTRSSGNSVEIDVTDNGRGIPEMYREKIFRTAIPKNKDEKGLGIGLMLARVIVQAYGGDVGWVKDKDRPGTTMRISLPQID